MDLRYLGRGPLLLWVAVCLLQPGCFSPELGPTPFACATSSRCPEGYSCVAGICTNGVTVIDLGSPVDLPAADLGHQDNGPAKDLPESADGLRDQGREHPASDLPLPSPCADKPDPGTVALYTFEGFTTTVIDEVGAGPIGDNPGQIRGLPGITRLPGLAGCGKALNVPGSIEKETDAFVEIPDSDSWQLTSGSVDLWVRFNAAAGVLSRGIISRDASGTVNPGHFTLSRSCDNSIALRMQLSGDQHFHLCSDPVTDGDWHHVGINFGPQGNQLFVDGVAADRMDLQMTIKDGQCEAGETYCGTTTDSGIDGNFNPWVVGAAASISEQGSATPAINSLNGAIDSLRISSIRRSFGGVPPP